MKRSSFIAGRIREVLLNGRWIANTNYKELLSDLHWEQANRKVGNLNSIAALVFHVNYYLAGLLHAFQNGRLEISDKFSFDLPSIRSEEDWHALLHTFLGNAEKFADAVEEMDDPLFDRPFVDEKYGSYLRNIEAVIEHSYYHLGQISLLKKLLGQR